MIPSERSVAGLWCSEVLARLSEYVDGELTSEEVETVHAHLRGCNWCENFGGDFSGFVAELRQRLGAPDPVEVGVRERLLTRLAAEA